MKFNKVARIATASLLSLGACLGLTSCSRDYTVAFLYVLSTTGATDNNGTIAEYGISYETGALTQLASSGQTTQGRNPVALAISANQKNVYVINHDDSNIESLLIGTDGKLYPQKVTTLDGIFPTSIALSPDDNYMYVTFTYRKTSATSNSGPGGIEVYKMNPRSDSTGGIDIGSVVTNNGDNFFPVGVAPAAIAVGANQSVSGTTVNSADCVTTPSSCVSYVYVVDQDTTTFNNLLLFKRDIGTGALTPAGATSIGPAQSTGYLSGVQAASVVVVPRGVFVYVADVASNQIIGYQLTNGTLISLTTGPYATGQSAAPMTMTIDPRGRFLYAPNYNSAAVSAYVINDSTGALSAVSGNASVATEGTAPVCVTVENALGIYMYVVNNLGSSISGFQLNATTGALSKIRNSPYPTSKTPSCVAAVANGTHATQLVQ